MAIVIHTRKGKYQYAYEHTRVGDKVVSRYMYPLNVEGARAKPYHTEVAQQGESEYQKNKKEFERLKNLPTPDNETIDENINRIDNIRKALVKMNESNPERIKEEKEYVIAHEKWIKAQAEKEKQKEYVLPSNIKKGMVIEKGNKTYKVIKVSRVNCYIIRYPSMPHHEPQKVRIYDLSTYTICENS